MAPPCRKSRTWCELISRAARGLRAYELRAATSLARLLAKQGDRDDVSAMPGEIYMGFTEGFDTAT